MEKIKSLLVPQLFEETAAQRGLPEVTQLRLGWADTDPCSQHTMKAPTSEGLFQTLGGLLVQIVLHILLPGHLEYVSRVIGLVF